MNERFTHDLLNRIGAAKMNAELAARNQELPDAVKKNIDRVLSNLVKIQEMFVEDSDSETGLEVDVPSRDLTLADRAKAMPVLLIDDSEDMGMLFKMVLVGRGYNISVVQSEEEALEFLKNQPLPKLILLDHNLGKRTGPDLLDTLEKMGSPVLKKCKIVLFTGYGDRVHDRRAFAVERKSTSIADIVSLLEKYS